jgi:chromosome segregation ATPase
MQKDLKTFFGDHHGLDERSIKALAKALEKNNLPGFDYIEFKQALGRLQDMDMDEPTAFRSAFATASTVGLTKEKLLKTAEHYRKVLNKEKQQFDDSLNRQMEQRVSSKQQEVEKLKKQIEEHKAKIRQLQEKVERAQATIDHADEHIQDAKSKLMDTKEKFDHALQSIVNEIEKDIENIGTYL